mgnify:CR=1 FL=1
MRQLLCAGLAGLLCTAPVLAEPELLGPDEPAIEGDPVSIAVTGLEPGQRVRFIAERANLYRQGWLHRSEAVFTADEQGVVDPTRQAPVEGDWQGADRFAFLWAMAVNSGDEPPEGVGPYRVRLSADVDMDGGADLERWLEFKRNGFTEVDASTLSPGAFLLVPEGQGPFPAIIMLGGSEGGDYAARTFGPGFAERGYAVLGLPYYSPAWGGSPQFPELPQDFVDIPVELAAQARDWLAARDEIDADAIAVMGDSKGAEMALAAASYLGGFAAVAATVPTDVIWEGWGLGVEAEGTRSSFSLHGEPLDFVPYEGMRETLSRQAQGERVNIRRPHDEGRAANPDAVAAARIPVERIDAPVYLLGGLNDQTWASGDMALNIADAREAASLPTTALVFGEAGHGLGGPPTRPSDPGTAAANAEAFPALLDFLDAALRR